MAATTPQDIATLARVNKHHNDTTQLLNTKDYMSLSETSVTDRTIYTLWDKNYDNIIGLEVTKSPSLTDSGVCAIGRFVKLKTLTLSGCPNVTTRGLMHLGKLINLESLTLDGPGWVTEDALKMLGKKCPNLETLRLTDTGICDEDLSGLKDMSNLKYLTLDFNNLSKTAASLTGSFLRNICNDNSNNTLQHLSIRHSLNLNIDDLTAAVKCSSLTVLILSRSFLNDLHAVETKWVTEDAVKRLGVAFPKLEKLTLNNADISDPDLSALENMRNLKYLNLDGSRDLLTGSFMGSMKNTLQHLSMRSCEGLSVKGLTEIGKCKFLQYLNLARCLDDNLDFNLLSHMPELHTLDLSGTLNLTDDAFGLLKGMPKLATLILINCKALHGSFLTLLELTTQNTLTRLDLRCCEGLVGMNLKFNACKSLERLDFSPDPNRIGTGYYSAQTAQITDENLLDITSNSHKLTWLNLNGCQITDKGLVHLSSIRNSLGYLRLTGCNRLTEAGILDVLNSLNLTRLALGDLRCVTEKTKSTLRSKFPTLRLE
jgi:Leucine-rich repeat (LRR) protein